MPSDTESESEQSAPEVETDEENRVSEDEEYPISDNEEEENNELVRLYGATAAEQSEGEESEENVSDEGDDEEEAESGVGMKGWAGSMAKVLKSDKTAVLSKAKKVEDVEKKKEKKSYSFEIEGEIKTEKDEKPNEDALKRALEKRKYRERRENKMRVFNLRLKPSISDLDRERTFKKIATRGVVQLFNAVKSHQSEMDIKLQSTKLESKRDEIMRSADNKKEFLNKLMSGPRSKSELIDGGVKKEKKKREQMSDSEDEDNDESPNGKSNWSALRDDFMTGKKVGWDKEDDSEEDDDQEMESESD